MSRSEIAIFPKMSRIFKVAAPELAVQIKEAQNTEAMVESLNYVSRIPFLALYAVHLSLRSKQKRVGLLHCLQFLLVGLSRMIILSMHRK